MIKIKPSLFICASLIIWSLQVCPAHAQSDQTFVSANGSDGNNSTLASPCRTFQKAISATNAGGIIEVLDSAEYGQITISKSISIISDSSKAGILVPTGQVGIAIVNGSSSDVVYLRGLTIEGVGAGGVGTGNRGIVFTTGSTLTVENCAIRNLSGDGIDFEPSTALDIRLIVSNTLVTDVARNGGSGVAVLPRTSSGVWAIFNRFEVYRAGVYGLTLSGAGGTGPIYATVTDSVASANGAGIATDNSIGAKANVSLMLVRSLVANNTTGIIASGTNATVRLAQSTLTGNLYAYSVKSGGILLSYGDNYIDGNIANESAPPGIPKK